MYTVITLISVLALASASIGQAENKKRNNKKNTKVEICHRTHSNGYNLLKLPNSGANNHLNNHSEDGIAVNGSCQHLSSQTTGTGPAGPAGADGVAGPAGADGVAGPAGADGVAGADGLDGLDGIDGIDGIDGVGGSCEPILDIANVTEQTFFEGGFQEVKAPDCPVGSLN